jgi:hypothetical protein
VLLSFVGKNYNDGHTPRRMAIVIFTNLNAKLTA